MTSQQHNESDKAKTSLIEAALYVTGKPLDIKILGSVVKARSETKVRSLARQLIERYRQNGGSIEVLELQDGRFVMQLKSDFVRFVKRLSTRPLLTVGPLKTLSFIAFKQPITQSYVVRVRGKPTYKHVRQLKDLALITVEKLGRTKVLRTTTAFADYFNLSHDPRQMKRQLERLFEGLRLSEDGEKSSIPARAS